MTTTATRKPRRTPEQIKHDFYLKLVVLRRQGRLHRVTMQAEHCTVWCKGEAIELYASKTYPGYAYAVRNSECGCEGFEHRHTCSHVQDASRRAVARYYAAQQVASVVLGEDAAQHIADELTPEEWAWFEEPWEKVLEPVAVVAQEVEAIESRHRAERRLKAPLNGNGGFSLLKPVA